MDAFFNPEKIVLALQNTPKKHLWKLSWRIGVEQSLQVILRMSLFLLVFPILHLLGIRVDLLYALFAFIFSLLVVLCSGVATGTARAIIMPAVSFAVIPLCVTWGVETAIPDRFAVYLYIYCYGLAALSLFGPFPIALIPVVPLSILVGNVLSPLDGWLSAIGYLLAFTRFWPWFIENLCVLLSPDLNIYYYDKLIILPVLLPSETPPMTQWYIYARNPFTQWAVSRFAKISNGFLERIFLLFDNHLQEEVCGYWREGRFFPVTETLAALGGIPFSLSGIYNWGIHILTSPLRKRIPRGYQQMFRAWHSLCKELENVIYQEEIPKLSPALHKVAIATRPIDPPLAGLCAAIARTFEERSVPEVFGVSGESVMCPSVNSVIEKLSLAHQYLVNTNDGDAQALEEARECARLCPMVMRILLVNMITFWKYSR